MTDETQTWTCPGCDEEYDARSEDGALEINIYDRWEAPVWSEWKEEDYCYGCYESDISHWDATFVRFFPDGEEEVVKLGSCFAEVGEYGEGLPPEWVTEKFDTGWKTTGGYRGYFNVEAKKDSGFTLITSGWVTGYPDETVQHKLTAIEVFELFKGGERPECDVIWVFATTSNVFSMATDVFVEGDANVEVFNNWLETQGQNPAKFDRAFG